MYTTYHIFLVLPIKDLINEDGDPITPHKLATGTKTSVSHLRVLFYPCAVRKATSHVETKTLMFDCDKSPYPKGLAVTPCGNVVKLTEGHIVLPSKRSIKSITSIS